MHLKKIYIIYLMIEFILYLFFLSLDFYNQSSSLSNQLKYLSLLLTFGISFLLLKNDKKNSSYLMTLFCIAIADYYLLFGTSVIDENLGIGFFIAGHLFLQTILNKGRKILIINVTIILLCLLLPLHNQLVYRFALAYASILIVNVCLALRNWIKLKTSAHFFMSVGYLLLLCCDLCVGLNYLNFGFANWMWFFYLPSFVFMNIAIIKPQTKVKSSLK